MTRDQLARGGYAAVRLQDKNEPPHLSDRSNLSTYVARHRDADQIPDCTYIHILYICVGRPRSMHH